MSQDQLLELVLNKNENKTACQDRFAQLGKNQTRNSLLFLRNSVQVKGKLYNLIGLSKNLEERFYFNDDMKVPSFRKTYGYYAVTETDIGKEFSMETRCIGDSWSFYKVKYFDLWNELNAQINQSWKEYAVNFLLCLKLAFPGLENGIRGALLQSGFWNDVNKEFNDALGGRIFYSCKCDSNFEIIQRIELPIRRYDTAVYFKNGKNDLEDSTAFKYHSDTLVNLKNYYAPVNCIKDYYGNENMPLYFPDDCSIKIGRTYEGLTLKCSCFAPTQVPLRARVKPLIKIVSKDVEIIDLTADETTEKKRKNTSKKESQRKKRKITSSSFACYMCGGSEEDGECSNCGNPRCPQEGCEITCADCGTKLCTAIECGTECEWDKHCKETCNSYCNECAVGHKALHEINSMVKTLIPKPQPEGLVRHTYQKTIASPVFTSDSECSMSEEDELEEAIKLSKETVSAEEKDHLENEEIVRRMNSQYTIQNFYCRKHKQIFKVDDGFQCMRCKGSICPKCGYDECYFCDDLLCSHCTHNCYDDDCESQGSDMCKTCLQTHEHEEEN